MTTRIPIDTHALETVLGHRFSDPDLLLAALTHPSLGASRTKTTKASASAYERLEFLGDRVLGLVIAHWLYALLPAADEGEMAKRHAYLVNRDTLRAIAMQIDLAQHLRVAHGESVTEGRKNLAALSDAMEGLIGALYLDGGQDAAEAFIKRQWEKWVSADLAPPADPKTALQEYAQCRGLALPVYKVIERSGPSHAPKFVIQASLSGFEPQSGEGGSKREAEKKAAQALLERIEKA